MKLTLYIFLILLGKLTFAQTGCSKFTNALVDNYNWYKVIKSVFTASPFYHQECCLQYLCCAEGTKWIEKFSEKYVFISHYDRLNKIIS